MADVKAWLHTWFVLLTQWAHSDLRPKSQTSQNIVCTWIYVSFGNTRISLCEFCVCAASRRCRRRRSICFSTVGGARLQECADPAPPPEVGLPKLPAHSGAGPAPAGPPGSADPCAKRALGDGKFDILLSTTIIEPGIDIPILSIIVLGRPEPLPRGLAPVARRPTSSARHPAPPRPVLRCL